MSGASVLKYELVEKQSKKVLVAKRCSMRHNKKQLATHVQEAALECSFDYKPSEFENLFKPQDEDHYNQQMQEIAFQHSTKIARKDIAQVLGQLSDELALVHLKKSVSKSEADVFTKVALYLGTQRLTDYIKDENERNSKYKGFLLVESKDDEVRRWVRNLM